MIQTLSQLLTYNEFNGLLERAPQFSLPNSKIIIDLNDTYNIDYRKNLLGVYINFGSKDISETMRRKRGMLSDCWNIIHGVVEAQEPERELAKLYFKTFLCPAAVKVYL